ncbi:DNA-formamidopyrimidine glycosylase family protein [Coralloluteibacterium thermophilus]|uniref:DNA-formamidopyrimidine glycosylase family protein n=1 Tax=Coralloluteibacterium thermophilum TaxID=2707049 RepID=A0ABV9NM13_9GAMM
MPEGPSLVILREALAPFVGRRVREVGGNTTRIDPQRLLGQPLTEVRTFGKQLLLAFPATVLRVHFLLFGSHRIDDPKPTPARLHLGFGTHALDLYGCSLRYIDTDLDAAYDWSVDVMADAWDPRAARRRLRARPDMLACDALLDQDLFAGVGNIIKNEVLFRIRVHPESRVGALPPRKLGDLVREARAYSFDFLAWKRDFVLARHWCVHNRQTCPRCHVPLHFVRHLGAARRRAFFCTRCQRLYR